MPIDSRIEFPKVDIDTLKPTRSLIDLDNYRNDTFSIHDYTITDVFDDILLVQFVDITSDGESIVRNGILIPVNQIQKAWRLGKVILAGPNCKYTKVGDTVCFPNDKGIPVSNLPVKDIGVLKNALFLNEERLFARVTSSK